MSNNSSFDVVLEKMIDSQISNTEALTSLNQSINELNVKTSEIRSHFSNGFRSELKNHITNESKAINGLSQEISEKLNQLTEEVRSFKKISFWVKVIAGMIAAISAIAVAAANIVSKMGS